MATQRGRSTTTSSVTTDQLLQLQIDQFNALVLQTQNFREDETCCFGAAVIPVHRDCKGGLTDIAGGAITSATKHHAHALHSVNALSNLCLVCDGIKYTINGKVHVFDTLMHLYCFLVHGVPENVGKWVKGGVMSDFVSVFGHDQGGVMRDRHGADMIGLIPHLLVQKNRSQKRAQHGIVLRPVSVPAATAVSYSFWRPILHAKFAAEPQRFHLLNTGNTYLLDQDATPMGAYPSVQLKHGDNKNHEGGRVTFSALKGSGHTGSAEYAQQKREGKREGGILTGTNRMGKFLMAIRSEVRLMLMSAASPKVMKNPTTTVETLSQQASDVLSNVKSAGKRRRKRREGGAAGQEEEMSYNTVTKVAKKQQSG